MYYQMNSDFERGVIMAFGKNECSIRVLESKLKLFHEHLGNFIDDLNKICNECGSVDTDIDKTVGTIETYQKVKKCNECGDIEFVEEIVNP